MDVRAALQLYKVRNMAWQLIEDIRYPDYGTYRGKATEFNTEWNSVLDLIIDTHRFVTDLITNITITFNQVQPLQVLVWKQYETWYGIPYWHYRMKIYAHDSPLAPAVIAAILSIIQIAVIAIAAWIILNSAKEIIWGPPEISPFIKAIIPLAIAFVAIAYAYSKFVKK